MKPAPYGTQPKVGDIMWDSGLNFDEQGTPIKEVIACPTAYHPHKVKVRILKDDTWLTLWFGWTPWKLMQPEDRHWLQVGRVPDGENISLHLFGPEMSEREAMMAFAAELRKLGEFDDETIPDENQEMIFELTAEISGPPISMASEHL